MVTDATCQDSSATLNTQPRVAPTRPVVALLTRRSFSGRGSEGVGATKGDRLSTFPSLGSAHRGGNAFPFRRQAGKIMGQSGEIAIDRSGMAARCVSRWIFQGRG